jgi:fructose-bisphosphate aldolase class I
MKAEMAHRVRTGKGFIAALDQSGGSTPTALSAYGISGEAYSDEDGMFALMDAMRVRVMIAPRFNEAHIIGAILFERTMDEKARGKSVPAYLWEERGIVPFLKVDKGLEGETEGVQLMKPVTDLDMLLGRAVKLSVYGTKMRSVIRLASRAGIAAILAQQFTLARLITRHGLLPIIEPEILVASPEKAAAEVILLLELKRCLDLLPDGTDVVLKVTLPEIPDLYAELASHPRVVRLLALSGGFGRSAACARLAQNHHMIASFSRALLDDLKCEMDDATFNTRLAASIYEIFEASTVKH